MTIDLLLDTLSDRAVRLRVVGDKIRCTALKGALDEELIDAIRHRKQEIIAQLKEPLTPPKPSWRQYHLDLARRWTSNARMCDRLSPEAAAEWRWRADRHRELAAEQGVSSQIAGGEAGRSANARS